MPEASLTLLYLRRALHPGLAAALIVLALVLAGADWGQGTALLGTEDPELLARGLARQGVWLGLAVIVAPAAVVGAARVVARWRAGEADWLAARARGPATAVASAWLGIAIGCALACLLVLAAAELAAGPGGDAALRAAGELAPRGTDGIERLPGVEGVAWTVRDPGPAAPAGSVARLRVGMRVWSGPAADVRLTLERVGPGSSGARGEVARRLSRAGLLALELPPGPGDLRFVLARESDGAAIVVERAAAELFVPAGNELLAGLALLCHVWAALAAWTALALGLGAWMSPAGATVSVAGLQAALWLAPVAPRALPAVALPAAFARAGEGLVPAALGPAAGAATAAAVLVGLTLAVLGLRAWRREA